MRARTFLLPCLISCFMVFIARAQEAPELRTLDSIGDVFLRSAAQEQPTDLFLHLDKTVYVHGENIWFSAYILGGDTALTHHTLHTVLIEEASKKVFNTERFVIAQGTSGGAIFLPDSLPMGEYRLLAYTNQYRSYPQQPIFQQAITLKGGEQNIFRLELKPDNNPAWRDSVYFTYKVLTGYSGLASGGEMVYTLLADGHKLQNGKRKIDPFGEVSFVMAKQAVQGKRIQLQATVTRDKNKQTFRADVPLLLNEAQVKLYPEGGDFIHLHETKFALEIRNGVGTPIATSGQLLANGQLITTFQTSLSGTATLPFLPNKDLVYMLRLNDSSYRLSYTFPTIRATGYSLHLPESVIADSSFRVEIGSPGSGACHILVHNYREAFFSGTFRTGKQRSLLRLSTADMPEGVVTLTLFDAFGTPQAERAVFIRRKIPVRVSLSTDSAVYHHRSKLQLKVKVTDYKGQPVRSMFSLACVLASRIDTTRAGDIVRFIQFDRFLPSATAMPGVDYFTSDANIEQLLLTRYWTRYRWEAFNKTTDFVQPVDQPCETGHVLFREKTIKKPVPIIIIGTSGSHVLSTDSAGFFSIDHTLLATEQGKKPMILASDPKNTTDYRIVLDNQCSTTDTTVAQQYWPPTGYMKAVLSVQEQEHLRKSLQAVVVVAKKTDTPFGMAYKSTTCNDWVCMYNILNCQNHPTGSMPVSGQQYSYRGRMVIYEGCGNDKPPAFLLQINGIAWPKEYYVADYEKFNPTEPELMSTIYWNYQVFTDENGEATLPFSTNDLNGRFVCVLQGVTGDGAIHGRHFFKVVE
ncbi:hypothetical protein [Paraflavitalea pollutisoli]|uniref:hypothetical protein n=1 Tax=Paraflavitalea pollutisoli TaxID=3034143 RepID=UPI0023EAF99B|nr:hypothetical protein [Paraflavitalea sp. H1-2-19X]